MTLGYSGSPSRLMLLLGALLVTLAATTSGTLLVLRGEDRTSVDDDEVTFQALGEPGVGGQVTALAFAPDAPQHLYVGGDLLGIGRSVDGGASWTPGEGLLGWEISSLLALAHGEVWAGTMSGPVVSEDGGRTWQARREGMPTARADAYTAPVQPILQDPRDPGSLLALGGTHRRWPSADTSGLGAVWSSTDRGQRWERVATINEGAEGDQRNVVDAIALTDDPDVLISALDGGGVWRSQDRGRSWSRAQGGLPEGRAMSVTETDGAILVAYESTAGDSSGGIWRSADGGRTWSSSSSGLRQAGGNSRETAAQYRVVRAAPSRPGTVYTADAGFDSPAVYRSSDAGRTWEAALEPGEALTAYSSGGTADVMVVDPGDPDRVLVGQSEYVLLSADGGGDWEDVTSTSLGDDRFAGRGYSGLVATDVAPSPSDDRLALTSFDGGNLLVGSAHDGWVRPLRSQAPYGGGRSVTWAGEDADVLLVALGQNEQRDGLARSADDGRTWTLPVGNGLPAAGVCGVTAQIGTDRAWATAGGDVYASEDAGSSWRRVVDGQGRELCRLAVDENGQVAVSGPGGVYALDGGSARLLDGSPGGDIRLAYGSDGRLWAAAWSSRTPGLWVLDDAEQAGWRRAIEDAPVRGVAIAPWDPDLVAAISDDLPFHDQTVVQGVHLSKDGGETFAVVKRGLGVRRGSAVAFVEDPSRGLLVGTNGGGFSYAPLG